MIKSKILWDNKDYCDFLNESKAEMGDDNLTPEYPCIIIAHHEYDPNYCTKHRRGMDYYYSEFVSLKDFLDNDDQKILDYIEEILWERLKESAE